MSSYAYGESPSPSPYWSQSRRDNDSPFAKYNSQRSGTFTARRRNPFRGKLLRWIILVLVTGFVVVMWQNRAQLFAPGRRKHTLEAEDLYKPSEEKPGRLWGTGDKDRTQIGREKATMVMLVRNRELTDALTSMKQIEDRFNRMYHYPWTFLNDEPFTDEFINETSRMASGYTTYGLIPKEQWSMPDWIDQAKYQENIKHMKEKMVIYGDSTTYRHMCRYNSGFFFQHPSLDEYDWYWRVEPNIEFYCDQTYDPFTFMRENDKKYSFVISMPEYKSTVETLWSTTQEFAKLHPEHIAEDNALEFIADDASKGIEGAEYNMCHFWSNFEIGNLNFWRSPQYQSYFDFLDQAGGFYYERWGDAPVHSIAAALLLNKDQIHFFDDIGYKHVPWARCPSDAESRDTARCLCPFKKEESFDFHAYSCTKKWWRMHGLDEKTGKPMEEQPLEA